MPVCARLSQFMTDDGKHRCFVDEDKRYRDFCFGKKGESH
jgi:hypothetical protein